MRPVTNIKDVARAAGVSPATVSRVLNGNSTVSPDRAARVAEAAAALGYQPHGPARALRQQRTRLWAVIVSDIQNPFFTAMVRAIEDVGRAEGHRVVLCNSDEDPAREASYIEVAVAERMGGVVIAPASERSSRVDALLERQIPVVTVDRRLRHGRDLVDSVMVDNRAGALAATEHLIGAGAKRVACITGPARASTAAERLIGYRAAVRRAGREPVQELVRHADFRFDGGHAAALDLLPVAATAGRAVRHQQPDDARRAAGDRRSRTARATRRGDRRLRRRSLVDADHPATDRRGPADPRDRPRGGPAPGHGQ